MKLLFEKFSTLFSFNEKDKKNVTKLIYKKEDAKEINKGEKSTENTGESRWKWDRKAFVICHSISLSVGEMGWGGREGREEKSISWFEAMEDEG